MNVFNFLSKRSAASARKKAENKANEGERFSYTLSEDSPFAVTEAFRNLKMTLSVSLPKSQDQTGQSFLCTSSYPAEGKTTVAVNTAIMLSCSEEKTVLVDTDLRAGRISKYFKFRHAPGLSDYLSGQATLEEILHQSEEYPNLYVICRGTRTARPYELLASNVMKEFDAALKKLFSYVLYDSAPFRLVSDALAVATVADGAFLVTRHKSSYIKDISAALNALKFVKANILGIVVNDYSPERLAKKNSQYSQYYSYGYGDTPPPNCKA